MEGEKPKEAESDEGAKPKEAESEKGVEPKVAESDEGAKRKELELKDVKQPTSKNESLPLKDKGLEVFYLDSFV